MKKYLALVLGVIFTLGFAASAFAIHAEIPAETQAVVTKGATQMTLGGELRFRGEYKFATDLNSNSTPNANTDNAANDSTSSYDGRVRIRMQADVSKNTMGVIHLESGSGTADTYTWGGAGEAAGVYRNSGNGKKGTLDILEAWIQHKGNGLGIPAGIKIGHMPLKLGDGIFFNHSKFGDDAIVLFMEPTKELHISLLTIKLLENTTTITDDADAYVALFAYKGKGFNVSGDATLVDDKGTAISSAGVATNSVLTSRDKGTHLINYGLRADVKVGNLGLKADFETQSGKTDYDINNGTDIKNKGRAYVVGASYKLDPATLFLEYGSGSGDNDSTDSSNGVFVTAVPNTQNMTYVYDYRVASATGLTNTGIANTTYVKAGVAASLTKDLNADLNYYILRATKNMSGTAINGVTTNHLSKKIGSELDAKISYQIDKNLVYFVEGGYLWTGTFYDSATVAARDAYAVRHGLTLSF